MSNPFLLTPGPLTTSKRVKEASLADYNTRDKAFTDKIKNIRRKIFQLGKIDAEIYDIILMQGSGTFGLESVITSRFSPNYDIILVLVNGAYGKRICQILERSLIPHDKIQYSWNQMIDPQDVDKYLSKHHEITGVIVVHNETTTGILNPLEKIGKIVRNHGRILMVDGMSSFGGIPIDFEKSYMDYMVTSANKCLQGIPGFSIIIARKNDLIRNAIYATTLSLDMREQYLSMRETGQFRYTPPVQSILALEEALKELEEEGGIEKRYQRYCENQYLISEGMKAIGFKLFLRKDVQGPIITTFYYPWEEFDFEEFYQKLYQKGFAIYVGKLKYEKTFRIGNIGHIFIDDLKEFIQMVALTMEEIVQNEYRIYATV